MFVYILLFHILTVLSLDAEAIKLPTLFIAISFIDDLCPLNL